jgi:hypothetical protein
MVFPSRAGENLKSDLLLLQAVINYFERTTDRDGCPHKSECAAAPAAIPRLIKNSIGVRKKDLPFFKIILDS